MSNRYSTILETYETIHRNPINRAIHAIGIPTIIISVLGAASLLTITSIGAGIDITLASLIALGTLVITASWSWRALMAFAPLLIACYTVATIFTPTDPVQALLLWSSGFVVGWIAQLIGHRFEGHSPEFTSRPENLLLGPISVSLEVLPVLRPYARDSK